MTASAPPPVRLFNYLPIQARGATGEGGLITGTNPAAFTSSDPLRLWIIQVGIIIIMAQLLSLGLRRLRQPKVISEVLGGILLGPTAFGRIPGFTEHIFPAVSLPYLSLVANIGLCLFLFLVGLEIDINIIKRNARMSAIVSLAGIALPFGLGAALSIPLYHRFIEQSVHFTYFMLFTGVAYSITAFPVLCRVLTELKLLDTHVGIIVLSAGVGNDIVGWTLLALSVALVNAGSGLSALWILLVCIAFTIFLLFPVKFVMGWLARKTGSIENGPTMFYMTVIIILVWASAFFTDSIGVNAIFGAFLAGLVVPREGGLAITLTEKLEDMVSIVFLPLYFTLSGLNTNLGLLDNGTTWAFTVAIIALSFSGKFGGCMIASRVAGYGWREASTIGALMSCKGLVELIVLNVGLQAGILSQRVFSMFVLEALTLTFLTTPLVTILYPPERRVRASTTASPAKDHECGQTDEKASITMEENIWRRRFTVVLDKLESIPSAMALTQLVLPPRTANTPSDIVSTATTTTTINKLNIPDVNVEALQLIELSDRTSAMMKSSVADSLIHTDPVLGIFRMFGGLNEVAVTTSLSVVPYDDFAHSVAEHAQRHVSHLILLPWLPPAAPTNRATASDDMNEAGSTATPQIAKPVDHNPFDIIFGSAITGRMDKSPSAHSQFVRSVFAESKTDVALFIDTGDRSGVGVGAPLHLFLPFIGGPDDRLALEFVVQLCLNPRVTATVVKMIKQEPSVDVHLEEGPQRPPFAHVDDKDKGGLRTHGGEVLSAIQTHATGLLDSVCGPLTTEICLQSATADSIVWSRYATPRPPSSLNGGTDRSMNGGDATLRQALTRVQFSEAHTPTPVHTAICHTHALRETFSRLFIIAGRSRWLAKQSHHSEMKRVQEMYQPGPGLETMQRTVGDVGAAMVTAGSGNAVVVLQAANVGS